MSIGNGGERDADRPLTRPQVQKAFLVLVVAVLTILFLFVIRAFLVALILAGVFAALSRPLFLMLAAWFGGRRRTAALVTVSVLLLLIVLPLGGFLALVVTQAGEVSEAAGPWIRQQSGRLQDLVAWLRGFPFVGDLFPGEGTFAERVGELVGRAGSFLADNLRAATTGTLNLVIELFVMLYAVYFFLTDGPSILSRILYFMPLTLVDEQRLTAQFVSVTRATIKGSILVGLIQGALAGAAFFLLGLPGAAFWTTVMAVLSVIPVVGSAIIWGPAAIILATTGRMGAGIALAAWGLVVVGTIDNFLRPRLVGHDTKMHDLMVLISTFGGLTAFGLVGFIIGPIIAALFTTAWDLFGVAFQDLLDRPDPSAGEGARAGAP